MINIKLKNGGAENNSQQIHAEIPSYKNDSYGWNKFSQTTGLTSSNKSELQKYLEEEFNTSANLNILDWWKINSCRFPILSNIGRKLLAMPISKVAYESVFTIEKCLIHIEVLYHIKRWRHLFVHRIG